MARAWILAIFVGALVGLVPGSGHAATVDLQASIDAAQAGGAGRTGSGSGTFTLDTTADTLTFNITFSGLSGAETASHIHGPAPPGIAAGVLYGLPVGSPKIGTINLVDLPGPYTVADQKTDLLNQLWYVNIHSTTFPGGEIRGQIFVVQLPALGTWGIALLAGFFVGSSFWMARRQSAKRN